MRVPLPDSSAVEPSGFQITTSASSPSAETTSSTRRSRRRSGSRRAAVPALQERRPDLSPSDQQVVVAESVPFRRISSATSPAVRSAGIGNKAWYASHPLAPVGRVSPRAADQRGDRLVRRELRDVAEPVHRACRGRDRALKRAAYLLLDAGLEHLVRARRDPPVEDILRHLEADDERQRRIFSLHSRPSLGASEAPASESSSARTTRDGGCSACTRAAAAGSREGSTRSSCAASSPSRSHSASQRSRAPGSCRREIEVAECRPEVKTRSADDDGRRPRARAPSTAACAQARRIRPPMPRGRGPRSRRARSHAQTGS